MVETILPPKKLPGIPTPERKSFSLPGRVNETKNLSVFVRHPGTFGRERIQFHSRLRRNRANTEGWHVEEPERAVNRPFLQDCLITVFVLRRT